MIVEEYLLTGFQEHEADVDKFYDQFTLELLEEFIKNELTRNKTKPFYDK